MQCSRLFLAWLAIAVSSSGCTALVDKELSGKGDQSVNVGGAGGADGGMGDAGLACEADTCNGHGTCDDDSGVAECTCDTAYTGPRCGACALLFQDADGDGSCEATCALASPDCNANQVCSHDSGTAECVCDSGYQDNDGDGSCEADCDTASPSCDANEVCDDASGTAQCTCDSGYQDNDGDGSCEADCDTASLSCDANEVCDDASGTAQCTCDSGYQDNDGDGNCSPDCANAGLGCGTNQHCEDASGTAECVCDTGYTGDNCDTCDAGFQDNDGDGFCAPDCSVNDCSGHGTCDDSSGAAVCDCDLTYTGPECGECVSGYEDDGSGTCVWGGLINDPSFDDPNAWTVTGSADIDPGGWANFSSNAQCFGGTVSQVVSVASIDSTEPLQLTFQVRLESAPSFPPYPPKPGYAVNGAWYEADTANGTDWTTNTYCLGPNAYGTDAEILFGSFIQPTSCPGYVPFHIDNVDIAPADPGACPTPNEPVPNGDFSSDTGWYRLAGDVSISSGELLLNGDACQAENPQVGADVWVSSATTEPNLALELTHDGPADADLAIEINGVALIPRLSGGAITTERICIPRWARNATAKLTMLGDFTSGTCTDPFSIAVDDVQLVSETECLNRTLGDGDFEIYTHATIVTPWQLDIRSNGNAPAATAQVVNDSTQAYSGDHYFYATINYPCQHAKALQQAVASEADGSDGPALTYWYKGTLTEDLNGEVGRPQVCVDDNCDFLSEASSWTAGVLCIPPSSADRAVKISVGADASVSGSLYCDPAGFATTAEAWFDDLRLTTDPSCPAE